MCPPGVDQTGRTPQRWQVVLPTLRQWQSVRYRNFKIDSYYGDPHSIAGSNAPLNFGSKLARCSVHRGIRAPPCTLTSVVQTSKLLSLPLEIINNIFDSVNHHGVINLALTCSPLLRLSLDYIDRDTRKHAGPWADQPIAILGNYLENLPQPFFDGGLAYKSIKRPWLLKTDLDNGASFAPRRHHPWPARQFLWATAHKFRRMKNEKQPGLPSWLKALDHPTPPDILANHPQRVIIRSALLQDDVSECSFTRHCCFEESGCYLRNLTTKELVRLCICDGLDKAHARLVGVSKLTKKYMLDDIMLVQTRWSEFYPTFMGGIDRHFPADPRGPWAGHRFDVVTVKAHDNQVVNISEWEDVTGKVLIKAAWEVDYHAGARQLESRKKEVDENELDGSLTDIWRWHMKQSRERLRQSCDPSFYAEEILRWSDTLDTLAPRVAETSDLDPDEADPIWETEDDDDDDERDDNHDDDDDECDS